ncbi:hypothetical protein AVEN_107591-1 [Araneus ventricosus]|uniref:Uncharacterized protein n=1 Tax=Araneus ventricosus TaxID=182803 RepID=A0A4Y2XCG0_ARAVE|nr:hypothetical protein AVEN_76972-1 [Araneus ventricosus]GBO46664.1 hypothetical protein AVEN_107591-1 [Araneus ventricosus]
MNWLGLCGSRIWSNGAFIAIGGWRARDLVVLSGDVCYPPWPMLSLTPFRVRRGSEVFNHKICVYNLHLIMGHCLLCVLRLVGYWLGLCVSRIWPNGAFLAPGEMEAHDLVVLSGDVCYPPWSMLGLTPFRVRRANDVLNHKICVYNLHLIMGHCLLCVLRLVGYWLGLCRSRIWSNGAFIAIGGWRARDLVVLLGVVCYPPCLMLGFTPFLIRRATLKDLATETASNSLIVRTLHTLNSAQLTRFTVRAEDENSKDDPPFSCLRSYILIRLVVTSHGIIEYILYISSPNRDIEKIIAFSGIFDLSPKSGVRDRAIHSITYVPP